MTPCNCLRWLILVAGILLSSATYAQGPTAQKPAIDHSYKPLVLNMNEDGTKYIRFIIWHQFWLTAAKNSLDEWQVTPSLRRSRFLAYGQITPRFLILTHFGINSFGPDQMNGIGQGEAQMFLHDAYVEYAILPDHLYIGGGLHYWNGISRITSQSTLNFLPLDMPRFNWPTINTTDQFARHMGVYVKGNIGRLDYRLSINDAMTNNVDSEREVNATYATLNTKKLYQGMRGATVLQGYMNYQFIEQESNKLPYYVGSYLGKKKIFNIGFGFYSNPDGALILNDPANPLDPAIMAETDLNEVINELEAKTNTQDVTLLGFDIFYDSPIGPRGFAITAYGVYYHYDFGTNFLYGRGNLIGSGDILFGQVGCLLPNNRNINQLQPYITYSSRYLDQFRNEGSTYERNAASTLGVGLNYYINGHNSKITLEYQNSLSPLNGEHSSLWRLQAAIFL